MPSSLTWDHNVTTDKERLLKVVVFAGTRKQLLHNNIQANNNALTCAARHGTRSKNSVRRK
jgi:hypothetical protein